jgi:hypothetical protein
MSRDRFQPRDATRGGVNGPALPVQPPAGGKIALLSINDAARPPVPAGRKSLKVVN